jgi:hypothetical protein
MKLVSRKTYLLLGSSLFLSLFFISCKEDDVTLPPIGGFNNSDEVGAANLVTKFSFEDNLNDSKGGVTGGVATNATFVAGLKGKAYQGSANGFASFASPGAALPALTSITTSMWIKTAKHTGGAQSLFMLPKTGSFWGNLFMLIEGNSGPSDSMQLKIHFEKNVTPSIPWVEQWVDHGGQYRLPNMYNAWKHIVWTYDAATSKYAFYLNGVKLSLTAAFTDRYTNDPASGGVPLGPMAFVNTSKFIIGGFQNHLGAPFATPEVWMLPYTGAMDEFRIWSKALSEAEVNALYQLELAGR